MSGGMVIIGAGECGARAALALREKGCGGTIDLIGDEHYLPYERPPLSKGVFGADAADAKFITSVEQLAEARINHRSGTIATAIDRQKKYVQLSDGDGLPYDKLLLATGARPRRLTQNGIELTGIHYLRNVDDCRALREQVRPGARVLILGAGFLGLEIAATARTRGASVAVVESQPRILMRGVPEPIARVIEERHRSEGVDILCGSKVSRIECTPGRAEILLEDGRTLVGDLLVASVGAIPNTELAVAARLAVENGILVNAHLATSDSEIFAAGDCCAFPLASRDDRIVRLESWRNATEQSEVAASNMLGGAKIHDSVPWFWSDQYELTLQVAGLADPDHSVIRRDIADGAFLLFHLDRSGRLIAASGIGTGGAIARDIRLAEMLIARGAHPDPGALARPDAKLKAMLAR